VAEEHLGVVGHLILRLPVAHPQAELASEAAVPQGASAAQR